MSLDIPTSEERSRRCAEDGEFMLAARKWNGGVALEIGDRQLQVAVADGKPGASEIDKKGSISFSGDGNI